jgi:hypothetical protein
VDESYTKIVSAEATFEPKSVCALIISLFTFASVTEPVAKELEENYGN